MDETSEFDMFDGCPMCGGPMAPGEEVFVEKNADPVCPSCAEEYETMMPAANEPDPDRAYDARVDRGRFGEGLVKESTEISEFDKFMDRIVLDEHQKQKVEKAETNPQRARAARVQDRPGNKTRWGGR